MNTIEATLIIITMFAMRLALPLVLTLVFGYGMNYLLSRNSDHLKPKI
ncbi:MAG: hypothetical protein ACK2T3_07975 [Candidatus Promineifilaceae bacterium]